MKFYLPGKVENHNEKKKFADRRLNVVHKVGPRATLHSYICNFCTIRQLLSKNWEFLIHFF